MPQELLLGISLRREATEQYLFYGFVRVSYIYCSDRLIKPINIPRLERASHAQRALRFPEHRTEELAPYVRAVERAQRIASLPRGKRSATPPPAKVSGRRPTHCVTTSPSATTPRKMIYIRWDAINQKDDLDPLSEVHTVHLQVKSLSLEAGSQFVHARL